MYDPNAGLPLTGRVPQTGGDPTQPAGLKAVGSKLGIPNSPLGQALYYTLFPGGIADLTGTGGIFGGKPHLPYGKDVFAATGPFQDPNFQAKLQPGDPQEYASTIGLRNLAIANTLQMLGFDPSNWSAGTRDGLYNPPGRGSVLESMAALHGMAGGMSPGSFGDTSRSRNIAETDVSQAGTAAERNLVAQEPQRMNALLQMLLQEYGLGTNIFQQQQGTAAQLLNLITQGDKAKAGILGSIPIVGPLVSGSIL